MYQKKFKDDILYFLEIEAYDGPIPLIYLPENSIMNVMGYYIVDIEYKYYKIFKVKYQGLEYKMEDFVKLYPDILEIS